MKASQGVGGASIEMLASRDLWTLSYKVASVQFLAFKRLGRVGSVTSKNNVSHTEAFPKIRKNDF